MHAPGAEARAARGAEPADPRRGPRRRPAGARPRDLPAGAGREHGAAARVPGAARRTYLTASGAAHPAQRRTTQHHRRSMRRCTWVHAGRPVACRPHGDPAGAGGVQRRRQRQR